MSVVLYEKRDHVAYVTINRPEAMNAYNDELQKAGEMLVPNVSESHLRDSQGKLVAHAAAHFFGVRAGLLRLDALGEIDLLIGGQERHLPDFPQVEPE